MRDGLEDRLEELYVHWLEASERTLGLPLDAWLDAHVEQELHDRLRAMIWACDDALPPALELQPGRTLGEDFELLAEIGRGGFGSVWKARQRSLDRIVAIKILARDAPGRTDSFARESRHLAAAKHPGVVEIHSVGSANGMLYLVMEHVEGTELADVLRAAKGRAAPEVASTLARRWRLGTPAGDRVAVRLVGEIGRVVDAMHERGIHHRDLKPANVLVDGDGRAKVADFGLSIIDTKGRATMRDEPLVGTAEYMPPEVLRDRRSAIPQRADLWALSAILFELVTLERVYGTSSREDLLEGRVPEPRDVAQLRPDASSELRAVLRTAMARPGDGYRSVAELCDELERFERGEPVRASDASRAQRAAMWLRRHAVGSGVSALVLVLGITWAALAWRTARAGAPPARTLAFELLEPPETPPATIAGWQRASRGRIVELSENVVESVGTDALVALQLESTRETWLYVFNRGSSGRVWTNFPTAEHADAALENPLPPGPVRVPLGLVHGPAGSETFLVVASDEPLDELERFLAAKREDPGLALAGAVWRDVSMPGAEPLEPSERELRELGERLWTGDLDTLRAELGPTVFRWHFRHE